jgi:glycosyltransferase involved in cell wall biosynthesis
MSSANIRALFAPDYRKGVPYQQLLAQALAKHGVTVDFSCGYRRVMPLARMIHAGRPDILHLHWPEAYFSFKQDWLDRFRRWRLPWDVGLARRQCGGFVLTAHNLFPHRFPGGGLVRNQITSVFRKADLVIAHSAAARDSIVEVHGVPVERIAVIPHGDLSQQTGRLTPKQLARERLKLPNRPLCLMFGRVDRYKGIEEVVDFWKDSRPDAQLCLVGHADAGGYGGRILERIGTEPRIRTVFKHVPDAQLTLWLSACDCVVMNYRSIFTSGAASLARSYGIPMVLPARLNTLDLGEPNPRVIRFSDIRELQTLLPKAIALGTDYGAAAEWRQHCSWDVIAGQTASVYRTILNGHGSG